MSENKVPNEIKEITDTIPSNKDSCQEEFKVGRVIGIPLEVTQHLSKEQKESLWEIVRTLYMKDVRLIVSYNDHPWKF
jgi:hypothetical protein